MTGQQALLEQDAANRERALELQSFIVEAPAGAGKTELLTQRYLKLLAVVNEPEEIVAITFTNKAAAEMRSRILDSLQRVASSEIPDAPHKKITYDLAQKALARSAVNHWNLLEQPARLRINTIDSLCSYLARQMPLLSRFGGQPGVVEDATAYAEEAARRALVTLEDEAGDGVVTEALHYLDNDTLRLTALLADMLLKRDQWLADAIHIQTEVATTLQGLIQQDIAHASALLLPQIQQQLMPVARFAAANLNCDHTIAMLVDWDTVIPVKQEALPLWRSVCELLLTKEGEFRKEGGLNIKLGFPATDEGRKHKALLVEVIDALPSPSSLARIRSLPDPQSADEQRMVAALARLLQLAVAHLMVVFQEAGEVDFVEVATRALTALEDDDGATDLALKLDYRIQHLLVDEFQDTSPSQVALLEKLTAGWQAGDGRTLFCVGDPMQSIYRFRKADVGLFLQASRFGVGDLQLTPLQLTRNNRSSPAIVDWVNTAFAQVFPQQDDEARGAIRYRRFAATRDAEINEGVLVHPLVLSNDSRSDDMSAEEARYLTQLIATERKREPNASIAVLVRARAHLETLVAEIRSNYADLRFQAVEIEQLSGRQTVQDIHALTCALFHRADRVHWLAILRAPWCGLTLADLHALAADDPYSNIWQLMQDDVRVAKLSADGQQRLQHVRQIIAEAYAHQGRQSMRRWVESVWLKLGGAACLWDAGDVRDVQAFLALLEKMQSFDAAQLQSKMEKLYAAPDVQADSSLQFMTIHKSKGLEFDTVILPGLHRTPRKKDSPLLLWEDVAIDGAPSQLIAAPYVPKHKREDLPNTYDYLQGLEQERDANEVKRLLYVAATRTKKRLHLVAAIKPGSKDELKAPANTLLSLLWDSIGSEFEKAVPCAETVAVADDSSFIPSLIRLPQPAVPALLQSSKTMVTADTQEEKAANDDVTSIEASCGTLAHLYMEMFAQDGLEQWSAARVHDLQPAMTRWLAEQGHEQNIAAYGAKRVAQALATTLQSEQGRWVLGARQQAVSEYALMEADGDRTSLHIIDRTFIEDGVRWVIDYKSAKLGEAALNPAGRYRQQLERYSRLFKQEGLPIRKALFFMSSGQLVELD